MNVKSVIAILIAIYVIYHSQVEAGKQEQIQPVQQPITPPAVVINVPERTGSSPVQEVSTKREIRVETTQATAGSSRLVIKARSTVSEGGLFSGMRARRAARQEARSSSATSGSFRIFASSRGISRGCSNGSCSVQ